MARVLVLDDDVDIARMLARYVQLYGHEAIIETSSFDAVIKHARSNLDAAIVDLLMPRLSGVEVLAAIQEGSPSARRVLLTAAPNEREVTEAVAAGIVQMLIAKPPTPNDLERALLWLPGRAAQ